LKNRPEPCLDENIEGYVDHVLENVTPPANTRDGEHYLTYFKCERVKPGTKEKCNRSCEVYMDFQEGNASYRTDCRGKCIKSIKRTG